MSSPDRACTSGGKRSGLPRKLAKVMATPAWLMKPIQPYLRVVGSALPMTPPTLTPIQMAKMRAATSAMAKAPRWITSSRWSLAPATVKKTT